VVTPGVRPRLATSDEAARSRGLYARVSSLQMNQSVSPTSPLASRFAGTLPMSAGTGSMWLVGAITHNDRLARTGQKATQGVLDAAVFAGIVRQIALRQTSRYIDYRASGVAVRTFTFASIMNRQYHDKPLAV